MKPARSLQDTATLRATLVQMAAAGRRVALIHYSDLPEVPAARRLPAVPEGFAHALYASLRALDHTGADVILVEAPPATSAWLGVNDRLRRAAHGSTGIVHGLLNRQAPL